MEKPRYIDADEETREYLKKQTPKIPIDDSYPWAICPTCGGSVWLKNIQEHILNQETSYCEHYIRHRDGFFHFRY